MLKAGKLSHLIKELKQNNGKEQPMAAKKGETSRKDKALAILMPADMTGVPRHIAKYRLKVREGSSPVRQKKRGQAADRNQEIQKEVGKIVEAGIMKEVHYHDWLSNPVMVKKHDGSWRMCVDFKDLNKACPKDGYPLPEIDWKVESLCGFPFKCFLDAYKCYHQIQMTKKDEEKTTFITRQGIFCYTKMPFSLRNVRETYQRMVDKAFHKQIGRNLEVYVDDLVIKSRTEDKIVRDMEETFKTLREINMKLNPKSTTEAEEAFKQMKQLIAELPMLTALVERKELIVYFAASKEMVSAVLITEREAKQMPIYFVSMALRGPEINYTSMEKLVLALVHASKRLKRYFQAYLIIVITNQPIQQVLSRPKVGGRLQKWSIELGEYAIHYRPRVSVKGQILADFIVERPEEDSLNTLMETEEELPEPWILFTEGSSCTDGSGTGLILTNPSGMDFTYALRFRFDATNNEAEYKALIAGVRIAKQIGVKNLQANVDSRLVANQVNGTYIAKEADMIRYLEKVKTLTSSFKAFSIRKVPRSENKKADALSKVASTSFAHLRPFPEGPGKVKFLIVAMDYFTKWIEAIPVATITSNQDDPLKDWCEKLCIRQHFASVKHPQTNGLVKRANHSLGEGIKARLDTGSKNWMEELSHILWEHLTMIKSSNGDTPFLLTYRTEAVISAEISMPTLRTAKVDLIQNNKALEINLDLLEERREQAAICGAKSKAKIESYYNSKVRNTSFKPGDLVYRNNDASRVEDIGKQGPKWGGPYKVTEALGKGAYKLRDLDGKQLPRTWNNSNLKKYYIHKI
uniref:Reverse transcriptase domain-containing protein n=1 Tax=Tanacetum cinerariifolium TaxID=118510 RepID=A0A6L2KAX3_TANCI|nr:reverse transcriptase domain-containing protein [Tanacetum cinerariifolium]